MSEAGEQKVCSGDEFQSPGTVHPSPEIGIIARLFQACTDILTKVVHDVRKRAVLPKKDVASLRRSVQSLIQWGDSHDIMSGLLDTSLQKSRRLRDITLDLLSDIGLLVTKGKV
jgi:hypothetical protein